MQVEDEPGSYAELFDEAPCGLVSTLPDGTILKANTTLLRWIGRAGVDAGKVTRFQDLLTVPGRIFFETHLSPMLQMQNYFREVALDIKRDGAEPISTIVHATQRRDAEGRPALQLYALFDAAHRNLYERELMRARSIAERAANVESEARRTAERMSRAKDDVLALVSHELRTPLSAILGWTQVLRRKFPEHEALTSGLDVIERNARVQTRLVEDLLDMSRVISGKLRLDVERVNLCSVVMSALETVEAAMKAKGIRMHHVLDPGVFVSGDPARLQQVFWNLLSNAVKFTPREGSVKVVMQRVNSHVETMIVDSGQGMEPALIGHVFERFRQSESVSTRQTEGLGLGLSLVKYLVEMHGGSVTAESQGVGRGSTFTVSLPNLAVHPHAPARPHDVAAIFDADAALSDVDLTGLHVLVVDDSADARDAIREILAMRGARVTAAASAGEALSQMVSERVHVLISDIGLPQQDGYELIRRVRMLGEDIGRIPAIALTALSRLEDRTQALLAGYQIHLAKPVDPRELLAIVASLAKRLPHAD
jgi:signal transduction histidine kinase/ActR/RegA family two-component response regulator